MESCETARGGAIRGNSKGTLPDWVSPAPITSYLHRFHNMDVARSTVHRILIRYGMNRLPINQKR
jgi:hypothetical protein